MHLKLTREALIGQTVRPEGYVFEADGRFAEEFVRSGAAVPVPAPAEHATDEPESHPRHEKATRK